VTPFKAIFERSRLLALASASAPVAAALLAASVATLDSAPAPASAQTTPEHSIEQLRELLESPATPSQRLADQASRAARDEAFGPSPFHRQRLHRAEIPKPTKPTESNDQKESSDPPAPTFVVTSVMAGGPQPLATVNGQLCKIGDEVEPGWTVDSIDGQAGRVRLKGPAGQLVSAQLQRLVDR